MTRINPTSPIRSGFDYQDLWGLRLCGEWLANPDQYKWIQFETSPDEGDKNKFYLDDIICLDADDFYHFYQIKYKQDSTFKWTRDDFLIPKRTGGISLIKKWASSLLYHLDKSKEAIFVTNGQASDEVSKYIDGETLDIQRIRTQDVNLYNRFVNEIGNDREFNRIFKILHFRFGQENLSVDDFENNIRKYFYEKLNATESGVTNLCHEIHKECRKRNTQKLDIDTLRKWCEFDMPRPLEEQFDIPSDFEFFDDRTHQAMLVNLQKSEGGVKVIFGNPGVGKSVYLSKLADELKKKEIIVIKHHYHISPEDSNPQERLNAARVIEAIKSQLKSHRELLGDLANKNSKAIPLREFITTVGKRLSQEKKAFVIIVDGLDHALRYAAKEELETFLREICMPQSGVWIVIGMQAIAQPHLPQVVLDKCPQTQWTEIKGLRKKAVSNLIRTNKIGLHLPDHVEQFKSLLEKLFTLTHGNPLHLRYSLQQLKTLLGSSLVTEYSCNDLIPYSDGIEKYYDSLWDQISDNARTLLLTITSVNFRFTEQQLVECVSLATVNPADITNGFKEISHLISKNIRGQMNIYHNSFDVFLKERSELAQQKVVIKTNVKKWLEQSNYEYLKWAELRIIEHELGNSDPIMKIDRHWLIDSICYPCNTDQISNQMRLAAKVAFENNDFSKAFQVSYLHAYYLNSKDYAEEATELIWKEALLHNDAILNYIDYKQLPTTVFSTLVESADVKGNVAAIEEIIDILIERLDMQEYRQNTVPPVTAILLEVLPHNRHHNLNKIYQYIVQFRDLEITDTLFGIYSRELLSLGQEEKLKELLKLELTDAEKGKVLTECARHSFANNTDDVSSYLGDKKNLPLQCLVYRYLKDHTEGDLPSLSQYDVFPQTIREYDTEGRARWTEFFYQHFLMGLLYGVAGKQKDVEEWITGAPDLWPAQATKKLLESSLKIATGISQSKLIYADMFDSFSDLKELKWPEDRDLLSFQHAFRDAIGRVLMDVILLSQYWNNEVQIQLGDCAIITAKPSFFSKDDLIDLILDTDKPLLAQDVYESVRDEKAHILSTAIGYFPDRARDYARISKLARLYGDSEASQLFLKKATDNLLGYGYHKDVYLFDVLEAIEICAKNGTSCDKIGDWITRIIPLIDKVGEYTDGDETNNLPFELADLLAQQNPELLYRYYYWSADREELYHAEDLFEYVLKSLSFVGDVQIALASTAVDKDSFSQLKAIAQGNAGAAKAVDAIESYLGPINYAKEKESSLSNIEKSTPDYAEVDPDRLLDHLLTNFENRWGWSNYLIGWLSYWLGKNCKENIYHVVKQIVDKFAIKTLSGKLLDIIYPLAHEFDNNVAFDILCHAQENDHGWQRYWTDKKKAENRWKFIKEKYPQRYIEFFQKSTNYHVPLSRGVEFFLLLGDSGRAETITEASVQFAKSLMADISLPSPEWLNKDEVVDLDILIQRLLWPSPLVRERAASGIARLLCLSEKRTDIFKNLLSWIQRQKMETAVAIGLLPIIKAFSIAENPDDLKYINIKAIASSISVNSEVIEKLLSEISSLLDTSKPELPPLKDIEPVSNTYSLNTFFSKYVKTFLAPIYMQRAEEIERDSLRPFIKQWTFTIDQIIKETGTELNSNQAYYYARSEHDEFLLGFSSKVSEAYKSAFLRTLQNYYKNGYISEDFYLEYAYATLPIELSKWKVLPNRAPEWWPKLEQSRDTTNEKQSITPISFKNSPEQLIKDRGEEMLVAAEGAIQPADGWTQGDPSHSFLLLAFGYRVLGSELPTAEEIGERIFYSPNLVTIPSKAIRPFNFLEDKENHLGVKCDAIQIKGLLIYPIVARERDLCIALWQYFRDYDPAVNLAPAISKDLKNIFDKYGWHFQDQDGKCVARYADWLEGLKERYDKDMPIPHGQYLMVNKDFLGDWLTDWNLRLGYILKTTFRSRKYAYDEIQKYEEVRLLNVGNIII
jgi:hypothetical protein